MKVIICGAGEVGGHAAEVLANESHSVTVVDSRGERLRAVADELDVRTLEGNAASSIVLREAGAADADIVIGATLFGFGSVAVKETRSSCFSVRASGSATDRGWARRAARTSARRHGPAGSTLKSAFSAAPVTRQPISRSQSATRELHWLVMQ
jgi:2-polyprenyl-6-methoxyphenol hydroxylase-like FAD-dependent oxidoreductase